MTSLAYVDDPYGFGESPIFQPGENFSLLGRTRSSGGQEMKAYEIKHGTHVMSVLNEFCGLAKVRARTAQSLVEDKKKGPLVLSKNTPNIFFVGKYLLEITVVSFENGSWTIKTHPPRNIPQIEGGSRIFIPA